MWTFLLITVLSGAQAPVELQTLDGQVIAGLMVELNADRITIETADGPASFSTDRLAGLWPANTQEEPTQQPRVWVELVDGSRLVGMDYAAHEGHVRITMRNSQIVELASSDVTAVRLQGQTEPIAAEWSRILRSELHSDLLVVRKGDSIDYHRGVLHDVTDTLVYFELDGQLLPVKRTNVHGLVYYRSGDRQLATRRYRVTDADGSQWAVRSIVLSGDTLRWTTAVGLEVTRPLGAVVRVDFSPGKILYLSDLKPESVEWTPYFGLHKQLQVLSKFFGPRLDQSLQSGPLELDGRRYRKGLSVHSRTSLVYRLPGRFRRFKATVGIDDFVRPRGNVRLVIRGDDRVLLETTVAGTDPAKTVDLDLTGVRRLAILVDFGEDLDVADNLDLCDARIVK